MSATETTHLLILDDDGRPLQRLDGVSDWCGVMDRLLAFNSRWLVIEQRRTTDPSPMPRLTDIRLSRALSRHLRPIDIKLADHVIQGLQSRFSFREAGLL